MRSKDEEIRLASVLFAVIGVGYLFPFSALTQPIDYWHKIFPDFNIEFPLTTLYMWVNLIVLFLIVFVGGEPSYTFRIVGGFIGQFLVLVFVPSLYYFRLTEGYNYFFIMSATAFAAVVTSYIDSVAISLAAQYPRKIQESLQLGIGLSTLIGSIYRLLTKAIFPPEEVVESSQLYFYCGAATILSGIVAYYWLLRLPLSARCLKFGVSNRETAQYSAVPSESESKRQQRAIMPGEDEVGTGFRDSPPQTVQLEMKGVQKGRGSNRESSVAGGAYMVGQEDVVTSFTDSPVRSNSRYGVSLKNSGASSSGEAKSLLAAARGPAGEVLKSVDYGGLEGGDSALSDAGEEDQGDVDRMGVFRRVFYGEFLVFLVYCTSLALWPPLVTEIRSYNFPALQASEWWPLLMLSLFSVADCVGRLLTPYRCGLDHVSIQYPVYARLVLVPLLICSAKAWYFTHDGFTVLFVFLLGASNGYCGSLAIILVNEAVDPHERGVVGMFTGFFLNLGLVLGATISLALEYLLLRQ